MPSSCIYILPLFLYDTCMRKRYSDAVLGQKIYQIVAERMKAADMPMHCSENVFICKLSAAKSGTASYSMLEHLDNEEFLEAAYQMLLMRPVDEEGRGTYSEYFDLPKEEFRNRLLHDILHSEEYSQKMIPSVAEHELLQKKTSPVRRIFKFFKRSGA